jgi:Fe-S cluster assembly ATPase SufC
MSITIEADLKEILDKIDRDIKNHETSNILGFNTSCPDIK